MMGRGMAWGNVSTRVGICIFIGHNNNNGAGELQQKTSHIAAGDAQDGGSSWIFLYITTCL